MGSDRRFTLALAGWTAALTLALAGVAATWDRPDLGATRLVLVVLAVACLAGLVRRIARTNVTIARFVEALRNRDFQTRFDRRGGAGFDALGGALSDAMRQLQAERARDAAELRFWEALVDDVPVALLIADARGVRLANKAARRLFDAHDGVQPAAFAVYGDALAQRLAPDGPTAQEIVPLRRAGGSQRALVRAAALARLGEPVRVVAVEPIQTALDVVEVGTQTDLVRVLTHEILNSLTPVTSLAGTAAILLGEEEPDIAEARLAAVTLARRAEGLRRFIDSYRSVARLPEPRRRRFAAAPFAAELARLFAVEWIGHTLAVEVEPGLVLDADPDLLAQLLINLLRNAAQASERADGTGRVRLAMGAAAIVVEDDGPGIPAATRADVFLPFFTTRAAGTGIGLNLARQIAVAHGWQIAAHDGTLGGAAIHLSTMPAEGLGPALS